MQIIRFLCGRQEAILSFAEDRRSWWIGSIWVLGAALARRYDRVDLLAEPHHLLMPLAVSWFNASILFAILWLTLVRRSEPRPTAAVAYRTFLALFWLTAPLAWLYALPVERFLPPYESTVVNLWLLLIVASWRVLLYSRIVAVVLGLRFSAGFWLTMLFSDGVALGMATASPKPILALMGGLMHTPEDQLLIDVTFTVFFIATASLIVWLVGSVAATWNVKPAWQPALQAGSEPTALREQLLPAILAVAMWIPILPWTQSEQRLAQQVDDALAIGAVDRAAQLMKDHPRSDFPPHFNPRPNFWPDKTTPTAWLVLDAANRLDAPPWVEKLYLKKLMRELESPMLRHPWWEDEATVRAIHRSIDRHPELLEPAYPLISNVYGLLENSDISGDRRAALEDLKARYFPDEAP